MVKTNRFTEQFPECRENLTDCLNNRKGHCFALTDTKFDKPCPFYVTGQMLWEKIPEDKAKEVINLWKKRK